MSRHLLPPPLSAYQKRNQPGIVTLGEGYYLLPKVQKGGRWFRGNGALAQFPQNFTKQLVLDVQVS